MEDDPPLLSDPSGTLAAFRAPGANEPHPCVPSASGGSDTYYNGWAGFDSLPVITKSLPAVQQYFITDPHSITRSWLQQGASGWRLDVMGDGALCHPRRRSSGCAVTSAGRTSAAAWFHSER